jgi:mono/diheme cytochrome c family protein
MKRFVVMAAATLVVVACGKGEPDKTAREAATAGQAGRTFTTESLFSGVRLFHEHCAQCHGPEAQGHPDWQNPKVAAAPPLDGSGNVWKRRKQDMIAVIKEGVKRNGEPVMPAWKGRLSDREIEDIITWYQALWPADVYERWRKANVSESAPRG